MDRLKDRQDPIGSLNINKSDVSSNEPSCYQSSNISSFFGDQVSLGMGRCEKDQQVAASTRMERENEQHLIAGRALSDTQQNERNEVDALIGENSTAASAPDWQPLTPTGSIPLQELFMPYKSLDIYAMSADPDTGTLFLTYELSLADNDSVKMGVREISLSGSSYGARDAFDGGSLTRVWGVQFLRSTQTLLINITGGNDGGSWLLALSRVGVEWREKHKVMALQLGGLVHFAELTDGHVIYASIDSTGPSVSKNLIQVVRVSREQKINPLPRVKFDGKFRGFDAQVVGQDVLVALLSTDNSRVRVYRLRDYIHLEEPVLKISLANTIGIMWFGHRLLARRRNGAANARTYSVVELKRSGVGLELGATLESLNVGEWCDAGGRIAIFDKDTMYIRVFQA